MVISNSEIEELYLPLIIRLFFFLGNFDAFEEKIGKLEKSAFGYT